jgi:predicted RNase H-like HicB family nuclease
MANKKPPQPARSGSDVRFVIETEREDDGRWIAEIAEVPGALAYGDTEERAKANVYALALRVIADQVEKSEEFPDSISVTRAASA